MKGEAICHGAATIVNAIANGKGAAFGIDLITRAEVDLAPGEGIEVTIENEEEDTTLVELCVSEVLRRFAPDMGARVRTFSEIPVSRGLKSSSSAANAVVLASLDALSIELDPLETIRIGTRCAVRAGVSVTGAFDDAAATLLGGVVVTDNSREEILRRDRLPDGVKVLLHIPEFKIRKGGLPLERIRSLGPLVGMAFDLAMDGEYYRSMTLNGMCQSAALGLDQELAVEALRNGALAAGLSGTGPATAILVTEEKVDDLVGSLEAYELRIVDLYHEEVGASG